MKRFIIGISIVAILAGLFTVCLIFRPSKTAQITIVKTDWVGKEDYVPTEQSQSYIVKSDDVIHCGGMLDLEVTILKIANNSVTIETNKPMSSQEEPYVNLRTDQTRFTIQKSKSLRLVTPTTGAGDIYIFSLVETDD